MGHEYLNFDGAQEFLGPWNASVGSDTDDDDMTMISKLEKLILEVAVASDVNSVYNIVGCNDHEAELSNWTTVFYTIMSSALSFITWTP